MSYASIEQATRDTELQARVKAAALKEAWSGGPEFRDSQYGQLLRINAEMSMGTFMWVIAIDNEADYEYAVNSDNPNPGGSGVIPDAAVQAGIQAHWPLGALPPIQQTGPGVPHVIPGVPVTA